MLEIDLSIYQIHLLNISIKSNHKVYGCNIRRMAKKNNASKEKDP